MNMIILFSVALGGIAALWLIQTLVLALTGAPHIFAWPMRHGSEAPVVRWTMKAAVQLVLLALLLLPPWLSGESPWAYHAARLAAVDWKIPVEGCALTLALFSLVMFFNCQLRWITLEVHKRGMKLWAKLFRASLTPLPLALMEELVFRGIVLEQISRSFPATLTGQGIALTISAALFAGVHFFREQKQVALPAVGLFALGWTLGLAYLLSGHTIWIPAAFHATGVWFIQMTRPFASYHGPAWLIGYRSHPICGAFGLGVMALLTGWVIAVLGDFPV